MPKAKNKLTPEEQRRRFEAEVERLVAAGELNPTEADAALDDLVEKEWESSSTLICQVFRRYQRQTCLRPKKRAILKAVFNNGSFPQP